MVSQSVITYNRNLIEDGENEPYGHAIPSIFEYYTLVHKQDEWNRGMDHRSIFPTHQTKGFGTVRHQYEIMVYRPKAP